MGFNRLKHKEIMLFLAVLLRSVQTYRKWKVMEYYRQCCDVQHWAVGSPQQLKNPRKMLDLAYSLDSHSQYQHGADGDQQFHK